MPWSKHPANCRMVTNKAELALLVERKQRHANDFVGPFPTRQAHACFNNFGESLESERKPEALLPLGRAWCIGCKHQQFILGGL